MSIRSRNLMSSKGLVYGGLFLAGIFGFAITLIIGIVWVAVSPPWQARLFGVQTQAIIKSIDTTTCSDYSPPDPGFDTGGVVLGSFPRATIENNVLPTVQFTDHQGHSHTLQENYCGNYAAGEQVTLWYLPNDPTTFSLAQDTDSGAGFVYGDTAGMLLSLLVVLVTGTRFLVLAARRRRAASKGSAYGVGLSQADWSQPQR